MKNKEIDFQKVKHHGSIKDIKIKSGDIRVNIYSDLKDLLLSLTNEDCYPFENILEYNTGSVNDIRKYMFIEERLDYSDNRYTIDAMTYIRDNWLKPHMMVTNKIHSTSYNYYFRIFKYREYFVISLENDWFNYILMPGFLFYSNDLVIDSDKVTVNYNPGDKIHYTDGTIGLVTGVSDELISIDRDVDFIVETKYNFYIDNVSGYYTESECISKLVEKSGIYNPDVLIDDNKNYSYYYIEPKTKFIKKTTVNSDVEPFLLNFYRCLN